MNQNSKIKHQINKKIKNILKLSNIKPTQQIINKQNMIQNKIIAIRNKLRN